MLRWEAFPEVSEASLVDVGAAIVNHENIASFGNERSQPLGIVDETLQNGDVVNNSTGDRDGFSTGLDGFSDVLTARAPLEQGVNRINVGVADTGDTILDTILAIANVEVLLGGEGGLALARRRSA